MLQQIIICLDRDLIDTSRLHDIQEQFSSRYTLLLVDSYEQCLKSIHQYRPVAVILQCAHPVCIIHDLFVEISLSSFSPKMLVFDLRKNGEILYAISQQNGEKVQNDLEAIFLDCFSSGYLCHKIDSTEKASTAQYFESSRLLCFDKTEYLREIMRGVTKEELHYFKNDLKLNLNEIGLYVYSWNMMEVEFPDHNINKHNYFLVGEIFKEECQQILDKYNGGEVYYNNPLELCIIFNEPTIPSKTEQNILLTNLIADLKGITKTKYGFCLISKRAASIEDVRSQYDILQFLRSNVFFFGCSKILSMDYYHSLHHVADITKINDLLKQINDYINFDIHNQKLIELIHTLFISHIKPSFDFSLYYYCNTMINAKLTERYGDLLNSLNKVISKNEAITFATIEQKMEQLVNKIEIMKSRIPTSFIAKNSLTICIIEFLNSNYMQNITINCIASKFNVSASYLSQVFRRETGVSVIQYLINLRISKAKDYLGTSNYTISEIANLVGFSNAQYFAHSFKKSVGLSPTNYRKESYAKI